MTEAYPLSWPAGWPRTPDHKREDGRSRFRRGSWRDRHYWTVHTATTALLDELRMLGVDPGRTVVSSNVELRLDGLPRSGRRDPEDSGVAVYFVLDGEATVMARDTFYGVAENLRSLALAVEALRQLQRHGGGTMLKRAFAGFAALPPPGAGSAVSAPPPWWDVLGVDADAPRSECLVTYRKRAKALHPDNPETGDAQAFARLQDAWEQAKRFAK